MRDTVEKHMRELLEQYEAEQPARPDSSDISDTVLGFVDERNRALSQWDEYNLWRATEMAESFRNRRGRLPHSIQELLADPVCKRLLEELSRAFSDALTRLGERR
jgi:hypothetical protein